MSEFERKIGYVFKDRTFLRTATYQELNRTLAFFGDSALDFIVSEYLFKNYPEMDQGGLTRLKALVVSDERFNEIAHKNDLEIHLILKKGATSSARKRNATFLEAVAGAIYLDGGMNPMREFVYRMIILPQDIDSYLGNLIKEKVRLSEFCQQNYDGFTPKSFLIHEEGIPHEMTFVMGYTLPKEITRLDHDITGIGTGSSKAAAEENAAKEINEQLKSLGLME
ncbi:ribonuclease III family protein [Methanolapillus millepedarum]